MESTTAQHQPPLERKKRVSAAGSHAATDAQAFVDSHRDEGNSELFGITELCKEFGITLRALRFYEDKGLLSPRPLSEIKRYLDLYGDHGEGRSQQLTYVIDRTDTAIAELEQKRAQIDETLAELRVINASCRKHLQSRQRDEKKAPE